MGLHHAALPAIAFGISLKTTARKMTTTMKVVTDAETHEKAMDANKRNAATPATALTNQLLREAVTEYAATKRANCNQSGKRPDRGVRCKICSLF